MGPCIDPIFLVDQATGMVLGNKLQVSAHYNKSSSTLMYLDTNVLGAAEYETMKSDI